MTYRLIILLNFYLLSGGMILGATNCAQASDSALEEKKESVAHVEKASSSNIHIDEIVIKGLPTVQSESPTNALDSQKILALKISNDAQEDFMSWIKRQGLFITIFGIAVFIVLLTTAITAIWTHMSRRIETTIDKEVDKKVDSLEKKREEAIETTIAAKLEIERAKKALEELQDTEAELKKKLKDFRHEIDDEIKKSASIRIDIDLMTQSFESKITDEVSEIDNKISFLKLIINEIDANGSVRDNIVEKLILDLKSDDSEKQYTAAELLPLFDREASKIADAFVDILKIKPDTTLGSLLLSGLGELGGDGKILDYLIELVADTSHPNILAIIGALGAFGNTEGENLKLGFVVDRLLAVLQNGIDNDALGLDVASEVRGAIALALSCYGEKSQPAVKDLINLLIDPVPETRKNAAIALGAIGRKANDAIPALHKLKDDESTAVRGAALEAIEKIQLSA
ncbi:HEAT repeat domain-containing protein [Methylomicrobium sp. RS1]|uniref:HEAT repeat domain-containing protein n=1 Tax=Candidatus Methylomicrobium oryzae TaxID=2802053 RepID=UPI001924DB97|nr:HEAT repeat domain-containing protein [Methylomicrobium sp. RS1]MBL1263554.1 HEAT repeat domain-containing protein [Methylomicrobium sp. RS1]